MKKKNKTIKPVKEKFSITINLRNRFYSYSQEHFIKEGRTVVGCYLDFYRWFYQRDTPAFTFFHKSGADIIIRTEITDVSMCKEVITDEE
jgi:thioredoxin-related protein